MHRTLRWAIVGLLSMAVAFGCSNPDDGEGIEPIDPTGSADDPVDDTEVADEPEASEDPDPAPDPGPDPPAEIDITVIPDEITLEYVDAVLVELERLYAEAAQFAASEGQISVEVADRISSVFGRERSNDAYAVFQAIAESDGALLVAAASFSARSYRALEILDESRGCLWVETIGDQSGVYVDAPEPQPTFILLRETDSEPFRNLNQTPWVYHAQRVGAESELREAAPCAD